MATNIDATDTYSLLHGDTNLGTVTNASGEQPWMTADFAPNDDAAVYRSFFDACTNDNADLPEPGGKYPDSYFDDVLWFLQAPDGERVPISMPAVRWANGDIDWRWR